MFRFTDYCREMGIPCAQAGEHHHCRQGWIQVHCPFCSGERNFHLGFSTETGGMSCYRCGRHRLREYVEKTSRWSVSQTFRTFSESNRNRKTNRDYMFQSLPKPTARKGFVLPNGTGPLQRDHRRYLRSRGFRPSQIERVWGVQGTDKLGRMRNRLVIPIHNKAGQIVSYTTRDITGKKKPRYVSCPLEMEIEPHKGLLYGEQHVRRGGIIVVEGPLDAWRVGAGYAVATFGTSVTVEQFARLREYKRLVLAFDPDSAGNHSSEEVGKSLALLGVSVEIVELNGSKDWGDTVNEKLLGQLRGMVVS